MAKPAKVRISTRTASSRSIRILGKWVWHFQEIPHDLWDYDSSYEAILMDTVLDGRERKLLMHPNKRRLHVCRRSHEW